MHPYPTAAPGFPSLRLRLQAHSESTSLLRQRLYLWLDELGATGDEIFDVALASTEAFANAVEHPREPHVRVIDVDGSLDGRTITVTVRDYGSWNHKWQRKEGEEGGYGLPLIRRLMGRVELDTQSEGTTIRMQRQLAGTAARSRNRRD